MYLYLYFVIIVLRVQKMLSHSKEEVETLIKTYSSPSQLATFVVAMKRSVGKIKTLGKTAWIYIRSLPGSSQLSVY